MKKFLSILALVLIACLACTGLAFAEDATPATCEHVFENTYDTEADEPTCTKEGKAHRKCALCGKEYEPQPYIIVPALGHIPGEPIVEEKTTVKPTCVKEGNKDVTTTVKCVRKLGKDEKECGAVISEDVAHVVIPATGEHKWGENPEEVPGSRKDATCVEAGSYDEAIFCTVCGLEKEGTRETKTVEPKGHVKDDPVEQVTKEATCTEPGSKDIITYCKNCHIELERKTEVIPTIEHKAGTPVKENIVEPTCVDKGKYDLVTYCTMCGMEMNREEKVDETKPLKDHQWELDLDNPNYKPATCYKEGVGYYFCKVCGAKNDNQPIPKTEHNYGPIEEVPATCMAKGGKIQECLNDGCTAEAEGHFNYVEVYEIDPNGHKWELAEEQEGATPGTEGSVTRKPTCTKYGVNAYVCKYNETHRYAEQVEPLGHEEVIIPAIKAKCETKGYTAGMGCSRKDCDGAGKELPAGYPKTLDELKEELKVENLKVLTVPTEIPANGHTPLKVLEPDTATCTKAGKIKYICAACGKEVTEDTEAKGHEWVRSDAEDNPETCSTSGYISYRCANCGEEKREEVEANGKHVFSDWITQEPTCKTAGRIYRVCYVCGYEDVQEFIPIDPSAHQWDVKELKRDIKVDPTCTDKGFGKYWCNVCGIEKYDEIEPSGHNPVVIPGISPTCTESGLTEWSYCEWCEETLKEAETIPALGHTPGEPVKENVVEPTETEPGSYDEVVYCTVCKAELSREKKEIPLPKNGLAQDEEGKWHYYKDGEIDTTKTDIVEFQGGEFWVVNGDLAVDANGLTICPEDAYFCSQGQIQRVDGFAEYDGEWFMIKNGMLDTSANGIFDYDGSQFVFAAGQLKKDVNGLWENPKDNKWYYMANGQVQNYSGVAQYDGKFFVLKNGVLDSDYNGTIVYDGKTFIVVDGQLYDEVV